MRKALETATQADSNYVKDYNTRYNPTSTELAEEASEVKKLYYKISNCNAILAQSYIASGLEIDAYNRRLHQAQAVKQACLDSLEYFEKLQKAQHMKYEGV
jgi:hypothetical protein